MNDGPATRPPDPVDEPPGVPGFRGWRAVYCFVLGAFVLIVAVLALFSQAYR